MRLPRHHKVFRGHLDVAPFAGVFFLMVIFLVFHSGLVLTPGIPLSLPVAADLPGLTNQAVVVAVAENGVCFFENQIASENELKTKLRAAVGVAGPITLVLQADKAVRHEKLVSLLLIARDAGIRQTLIATHPGVRPVSMPATDSPP